MRRIGIWRWRRGGRERRHEVRQPVDELAVESPAMEVRLVNVSGSGLGIEAERPLRIGVVYPFRLRLDEQASEVYGLVRWCDSASPRCFRAGVSVGKTVGPPLSRLVSQRPI